MVGESFLRSRSLGWDPFGNAFAYVMTGNTTYGNAAVELLMSFSIPDYEIKSEGSDNYRWAD